MFHNVYNMKLKARSATLTRYEVEAQRLPAETSKFIRMKLDKSKGIEAAEEQAFNK